MYQLVLQFPAKAVNYDELIAIESELLDVVGLSAEVDGHDFGSGEANIFMLTDSPEATFDKVLAVLKGLSRDPDATVAYRAVPGEQYTVLWPKEFKGEFSIA